MQFRRVQARHGVHRHTSLALLYVNLSSVATLFGYSLDISIPKDTAGVHLEGYGDLQTTRAPALSLTRGL